MAKYQKYNLAFKLRVIKYAQQNSKNKAHKKFNVSHKQIRRWIADKEKIMQAPNKILRARIRKSGMEHYPSLVTELHAWILEQRLLGHIVDWKSIKQQALDIARRDLLNFKV